MKFGRSRKVNRNDFPLVYVGPTNNFKGQLLRNGEPLRRLGKGRQGLVTCSSPNGKAWQVMPSQLAPYEARSRLERLRARLGR